MQYCAVDVELHGMTCKVFVTSRSRWHKDDIETTCRRHQIPKLGVRERACREIECESFGHTLSEYARVEFTQRRCEPHEILIVTRRSDIRVRRESRKTLKAGAECADQHISNFVRGENCDHALGIQRSGTARVLRHAARPR